jgi:hypothetical protein
VACALLPASDPHGGAGLGGHRAAEAEAARRGRREAEARGEPLLRAAAEASGLAQGLCSLSAAFVHNTRRPRVV